MITVAKVIWKARAFARIRWVHRTAKWVADRILRDGQVHTIPFGPLRGMKWRYRSEHQFLMALGAYEVESARWLSAQIHPGDTVLDIGANAGYFTLLSRLRCGETGVVIAFDPVPFNVQTIRDQVSLNRLTRVVVEELAIAQNTGHVSFSVTDTVANSHLTATTPGHAVGHRIREIDVRSVSVDDYISRHGVSPSVIKIDVEGAESLVLQGAMETLSRCQPRVLVATHDDQQRTACARMLRQAGLVVSELPGFTHELVATP